MVGYTREDRSKGNPNSGDLRREDSRVGRSHNDEDIPFQDVKSWRGNVTPGNVNPSAFKPSTDEIRGGAYKIGPPTRPPIVHDNGFLALGKRSPTTSDYIALAKWRGILEGAELLRPDLTDAVAAYRHFLDGGGKPRTFSYERYVMNDENGKITLRNAILDIQYAAMKLAKANPTLSKFDITGPAIPCGSANPAKTPYIATHFPYPATENWQKTIGSHVIWLSGKVSVFKDPKTPVAPPLFKMIMTLHAEDRYNFNPGAKDIATKVPDSDNGRFSMAGLAHQYDHFSTLERHLEWSGYELGVATSAKPNTVRLLRTRQPDDNRYPNTRI